MTFCLTTTIIKPEDNISIKHVVILLHGYGGDGKDISMLTLNWKSTLYCINLFEYFLLVSPPLNRVPIPKTNITATIIKSTIPKIFTNVPEIIILL